MEGKEYKKVNEAWIPSPWFNNASNDWRTVFKEAPQIIYKKNEMIYQQGEINTYIYYVIEGRVRVSLLDDTGQEKSIIILNQGSIFGESCAIEQTPTEVTTTANTICNLAYIHRDQFLPVILNSPLLCEKLIFNLTRKLSSLQHHIREITFMSAHERVIIYLYKLSVQYGKDTHEGRKISISFTHQEMADLSGTSRVTVSNIMRVLTMSGIVQKINGYYYIRNTEEFTKWIPNGERR
ncbi:Crp/Fnr family transcriptional regulator [Evansella clarkii]|uniref:Crp/Fnr family transcriptional regulator n=1 Tax=Evansella clarkii TaxID=79879 RepID=UPI000995E582|nr:Crp/Fnr family transcriptional regulator [Evansella clarkii]